MDYLCLNCGHLNFNTDTKVCAICHTENDLDRLKFLSDYANRAIHYGYQYRIEYEKQVKTQGEVTVKYSLLNPSTYLEWIGVAALSGVLGNMVYDIVKHVANQVYQKLTTKQQHTELSTEEKAAMKIIGDNATLNKFIVYIQQYYKGMPNIDKKAEECIIEEEMIHSITDDLENEMYNALKEIEDGKDAQETLIELLRQGARVAGKKRREKPKMDELNETLKGLKKELKQIKKKVKNKK
jgi:hypothetical protein